MSKRPSDRRLILPDGELKRWRLPEVLDTLERSAKRRGPLWVGVVMAWLLCCWVGFHVSRGRWAPAEWLAIPLSEPAQVAAEAAPARAPQLRAARAQTPAAQEATDGEDYARLTRRPSANAAPPAPLQAHRVELRPGAEAEEGPLSSEDDGVTRGSGHGVAHWFPSGVRARGLNGCAAAAEFFAKPGEAVRDAPELASRVAQRAHYRGCKIHPPAAASICATLVGGRVTGVTVQSEPPSLYLSGCIAAAVSRMSFPRGPRLRQIRTEIFWN